MTVNKEDYFTHLFRNDDYGTGTFPDEDYRKLGLVGDRTTLFIMVQRSIIGLHIAIMHVLIQATPQIILMILSWG